MNQHESKRGDLSNGRQTARLGSGLEKSLSAYAGAAVAAGVSLLAVTRSVEAKVIYTPAHTNIPVHNRGSVQLDLNRDGIADFSFENLSYAGDHSFELRLMVGCAAPPLSRSGSTCNYQRNMVWGRGVVSGRFASALPAGFTVGRNKSYFQQANKIRGYPFRPRATMAAFGAGYYSGNRSSGQWLYTKRRYLGFKFIIDGQVHYGWARLNVSRTSPTPIDPRALYVTLTGYAYETIPNKPIITGKTKGPGVITPEPASLGHLAQGASGIPAWRKSGGNWKSASH